jgi:hypothetical protein
MTKESATGLGMLDHSPMVVEWNVEGSETSECNFGLKQLGTRLCPIHCRFVWRIRLYKCHINLTM